jgi:lysophospholipase L1-like esterase
MQILCYGDSNTWGCIPVTAEDEPPRRLPPDERWPGVLRRELGAGHWVVEEGLNARTTVLDDESEPHRNGLALLLPALLTHQPLDLVVLLLGTNDLKAQYDVSAREIADGAGRLVDEVRGSGCGPGGRAPAALLVCPPPLGPLDLFADVFAGGPGKSRELAAAYGAVASARGCPFLDAGAHVRPSEADGLHLDREAHAALGAAIADVVRSGWIASEG